MLNIRKRGRFYHVRGTIRVGKEKRIVKEHSSGCDRRETAETYRSNLEAEIRSELLHGAAGRERRLTFADAGQLYIDRPEGLHAMDVWRVGELNQVFGDRSIADALGGWSLFKTLRCVGLAPATVERFRATAQAALNYASREWGLSTPNLPKVRFRNQRVRFLSLDEETRLLVAYAAHVRPIMETLCYQGLRTQEVLQLDWRHVDLKRDQIFLARTKTGIPRTVPMVRRVRVVLRGIWEKAEKPTEGHVFLNRLGDPYSDTRDYKLPGGNPLRKAHQTALKRAKISDFRVHDWRHHWASRCVMDGMDLLTLQQLGGWRSLRMIERYAAVSGAHIEDAVRKIDDARGAA